jgi:NADPH-dependent 2,4-dienoyl-CoA reductase/sulfur reductase-like enzyme
MFRSLAPRAIQRATRPVSQKTFCASNIYFQNRLRRGYASEAEDKDLVIIGGGVAGYVAAIKAGQAGMKVSEHQPGDSIVGRADM